MRAGKPQKQALAIAYSIKNRAHKADGGMCECKGEGCAKCMDEGGKVDSPGWKAKGWTHDKDYNEGVHKDVSGKGESYTGTLVRKGFTDRAIDRQKSQMSHNAASPSPKLKGLAAGGPVLPGAQSAQDSMRKSFNFKDGGEVDGDSEIHDMLGSEMMDAIHSKDHKKLMQGIEAMVLHHMSKKED